jgi:conjugal transfer pilus assembly protein TraV
MEKMMIKKFTKLMMVGTVAYIVSGCSAMGIGESEFSCNEIDNGLPCASVETVYELTNTDSYKENIEQYKYENGIEGSNPSNTANMPKAPTDVSAEYIPRVIPKPVKGTVPVRTPAQVMRIYVAPWESKSGDLNVPGYVYTEVEPRRWMIGERVDDVNQTTQSIQTKKVDIPGGNKKKK